MTLSETLFALPPKVRPKRRETLRQFCKRNGILTHRSKDCPNPWLALQPFKEDTGKDIGTIMSESCRIYDESGQSETGKGELSVVRALCKRLDIPCDL